jgi:hypothetical protein
VLQSGIDLGVQGQWAKMNTACHSLHSCAAFFLAQGMGIMIAQTASLCGYEVVISRGITVNPRSCGT